ncbi:hsp70-like protein [Magnaporthiopsis poae ATCC 64411]|uniref:Hsp70-like protein n=1 Tax=Magnaporthiopsis poae (strain ATCC 64411 / 73-15) TaxID=644358 RepID=A0A0C4E8S5_MAGP6|nr:hsp70-like protein [Magnaporthiopsis poae ATCC 64411]
MDKNLNTLLKWSIENSTNANGTDGATAPPPQQQQPVDPELLKALFGGPSEAELMKAAMEVITSTDPDVTLDSKLVAFDNFEQLIESLDNANNLAEGEDANVRRKAVFALSSACRNYQPAMDVLVAEAAKGGGTGKTDKVDATNMDAVDAVMEGLRAGIPKPGAAA